MHDAAHVPNPPVAGQPTVVVGKLKSVNVLAIGLPFALLWLACGYLAYRELSFEQASLSLVVPFLLGPAAMLIAVPFLHLRDRKRQKAQSKPFLAVADDRIHFSAGTTMGREWRKSEGSLVTVTGGGKRAMMEVGAMGDLRVPLRPFDLAEVRAACLAHGWSWKEGRGQVLEPVPTPASAQYGGYAAPARQSPPAEPEVELVLRQPKRSHYSGKRMKVLAAVTAPLIAIALAALVIWLQSRYEVSIYWSFLAIFVVMMVPVVLLAVRATRTCGLTVTISRIRLAVRYDSHLQTVQRDDVTGPGKVGKRYVRFPARTTGWGKMWVPVYIRRDEVLAQLAAHGWDVNPS